MLSKLVSRKLRESNQPNVSTVRDGNVVPDSVFFKMTGAKVKEVPGGD